MMSNRLSYEEAKAVWEQAVDECHTLWYTYMLTPDKTGEVYEQYQKDRDATMARHMAPTGWSEAEIEDRVWAEVEEALKEKEW